MVHYSIFSYCILQFEMYLSKVATGYMIAFSSVYLFNTHWDGDQPRVKYRELPQITELRRKGLPDLKYGRCDLL